MRPEQMRTARALLNWSLDQLAEASGIHRNTIANFETGKYAGTPDKLAALKRVLECAGVIFIDENSEGSGARLRRFRVGDTVRLRPQSKLPLNYEIAPGEIGAVVGVESHPPQTGPTYRINVQFMRALVPGALRSEYELVKAATALSLKDFLASGGRSIIPLRNFIANPVLDLPAQLETDLDRLPKELGALIIIPTADIDLKREVEARGFFPKEQAQALILMFRQFPDGVLYTGQWAMSPA